MTPELSIAFIALILCGSLCVYCLFARRKANARADALLCQLLTSEELERLCVEGYLEVQSLSTPERVYRIPAEPGPIAVMDNGVRTMWLCGIPTRSMPRSEEVLVHKLYLEGAEQAYLRSANWLVWRPLAGQTVVWTSSAPGVLRQQ